MSILEVSAGEEIVIAGQIRITIVAIEGEEVCLAVSGPEALDVECLEAREREVSSPMPETGL